ncbi:hypothetical protein MKX03_022913, partial [Papaver bracteatum]
MWHKAGWKMVQDFEKLEVEFRDKGFKLFTPSLSGPTLTLNPKWFEIDQWS